MTNLQQQPGGSTEHLRGLRDEPAGSAIHPRRWRDCYRSVSDTHPHRPCLCAVANYGEIVFNR